MERLKECPAWTEATASEWGKAMTMNCVKGAFNEVRRMADELTLLVGNSGDFTTEEGKLKAIKQQAEAQGLRRGLSVLFDLSNLSEEKEDG